MATNSNEVINSQAKTTKLVRGIHSWIKFQKHQGVESLTIQGKQALADVSQDKNGDASLVLKADSDKIDTVASNVPYLHVANTYENAEPFEEKIATISQDLTQFPLSNGNLIAVEKTEDNLTIDDHAVIDFVNSQVTTSENGIRDFIGEVKTELTNKINEHSAPQPQPVKAVTNFSSDLQEDESYKYVLTGIYTASSRHAFVANVTYVVNSTKKSYTTTVYVPENTPSLVIEQGLLTFKVTNEQIELYFNDGTVKDVIVQGTIFADVTIAHNFILSIDRGYFPAPKPQ